MKLITRDTDYAIRALGCMAQDRDRIVTVSELAADLDMPQSFLRKILQKLNKSGILMSCKGKGGGFLLNRPASKISVFDVIQVFQGDFKLNEHIFQGKICPRIRACYLKQRLDMIEMSVSKQLRDMTIKNITDKENKKGVK